MKIFSIESIFVVSEKKHDGEYGYSFNIDLEDVLRFAAQHCRGIYERVLSETEESK